MSPRPAKFTQADVTRALKGAKAAGESVRVELEPTGKIVITPLSRRIVVAEENEWDTAEQ